VATGSWTEEVPAIAASKRREEFILIPIERYFTMGLHCSKTPTKKGCWPRTGYGVA